MFIRDRILKKKLSGTELFSIDIAPKVTDQLGIFPAASIRSCIAALNLKNASSLCGAQFNPDKKYFKYCTKLMGIKSREKSSFWEISRPEFS